MIPPNSMLHSLIMYAAITALASMITGDIYLKLVIAGAILGIVTESIVGLLSHATLRLSRPNAVMIRLLIPILLLPWALVVDTLSA